MHLAISEALSVQVILHPHCNQRLHFGYSDAVNNCEALIGIKSESNWWYINTGNMQYIHFIKKLVCFLLTSFFRI